MTASHAYSRLKQPDYGFHYSFYSKLRDRATAADRILTATGKRLYWSVYYE